MPAVVLTKQTHPVNPRGKSAKRNPCEMRKPRLESQFSSGGFGADLLARRDGLGMVIEAECVIDPFGG